MNLNKSIIEKIKIDDFDFFIKRDDLIDEFLNGNKARKLHYFLDKKYPKNTHFISYGSSQSNALFALSYFTFKNDYKLSFVCEKINSYLKNNPHGNYLLALKNNANIIENNSNLSKEEFAKSICKKDDIFLKEGIACDFAKSGYEQLAKEITKQSKKLKLDFDIFLPSGTGTSAYFLSKFLKNHNIYTCACVGDEFYLKKQILELDLNFDFSNLKILKTPLKFTFAKPNLKLLDIYKKSLYQTNIEFDLIYDSVGLLTMLKNKNIFKKSILYIHQGGILGNESMLKRYDYLLSKNSKIKDS